MTCFLFLLLVIMYLRYADQINMQPTTIPIVLLLIHDVMKPRLFLLLNITYLEQEGRYMSYIDRMNYEQIIQYLYAFSFLLNEQFHIQRKYSIFDTDIQ